MRRTTRLSDGTVVHPGDTAADIHGWNERIPPMSAGGADLARVQKASLRLRYSLRLLARAMATDPGLRAMTG